MVVFCVTASDLSIGSIITKMENNSSSEVKVNIKNSPSEVKVHIKNSPSEVKVERKRLSAFFDRRESIAPPKIENNDIDTKDNIRQEVLKSYYEKLQTEKEMWKKEVTRRQHIYHDLRTQCHLAEKAPPSRSILAYSLLTDEDLEYLKGREIIPMVIKSQKKLHDSVLKFMELQKKVDKLDEAVLADCKNKLQQINNYIYENSTVEDSKQ